MNELPTAPLDYDRTTTGANNPKYISPDRRATIICVHVATRGGTGWNCTLYEGRSPHDYGKRVTSTFAQTPGEVADAVQTLHNARDTNHD